ncbi:Uncharacterized protein BP5553_04593 [Venustampulla echinocandica]|uniref:Protein BFR2 n=1 Tax=Venustampulla echinocandica TaxID=2656787 RepID=A0A370TNQ8_9HELO|nr:Uncharacterized protein BP5553_04593 [Venustampulla echinocandica]RDL37160.1 Uncharacterized protein BP5553_04593 [Venustampulla echinocandica]
MGKPKSRAQQFADLIDPLPKDFDPEEDNRPEKSDDSASEDSDNDLAGTEHYAEVGKSKLRKPEDIALGAQYAGTRIRREALANESEDESDNVSMSGSESSPLEEATSSKSASSKLGTGQIKKRKTARDFMSDSEDDVDALEDEQSGNEETDEDVLDTAGQHSDDSEEQIFSTARQYAGEETDESDAEDDDSENAGGVQIASDKRDMLSDSDNNEDASESSDDEADDRDGADEKASRAELRKIMSEEQKTVVATISQAAKADADKGNAVKLQRKAFDSLLSVRMTLQKALIATNSMSASDEKEADDEADQPYEAAEQAAVKLWNTLDGLRHELSKAKTGVNAGQKRKRGVDISTPSSTIWEKMQSYEVAMIDTRQTTLEKWSAKVRGSTAVPLTRKLNPTAMQSITSVLQDQLASSEHLVKKTKVPRSCAPIQRDLKMTEDSNIYDDGNFYQMLLKELVDQRRVESLSAPATGPGTGNALQWTAVKEAKTKKNVDTKASKGRKMRYTVHEKLQNFMPPQDRGSWESDAIDRFFGTLLGQKMTLGEDEMDVDGEDELPLEEEGLKLFRSS